MKRIIVIIAWIITALVVVFTVGPVSYRPQFGHPQIERFLAFFALGLAWAAARPARLWRIWLGLVLAAILLESAQVLVSGRDPRIHDALAKIAGATLAVACAAVVDLARRRR